MKKDIFRKVMLDRLSSPEQLDQLMTVTKPRAWLVLGGIGLLLMTFMVWSILGQISTK
ncbi:MAG TPA: NHLP bacteriocin system secretion protein, partial [Acidimicrobiaceae bacterium]|nr:NHLP bacteriocin system secretion protein [Acidimicrobiaceae bacterium]